MKLSSRVTEELAARPVDWMAAVLLSWVIPLAPANHFWDLSYRLSLVFWLVPIVFLIFRFVSIADKNGRRRRAMAITVAYVVVFGCALDFILGAAILRFDSADKYIKVFYTGAKDFVPIEEVLFYVLGAIAILLTYFWADEFWLSHYNVRRREALIPKSGRIIDFSPQTLATIAAFFVTGVVVASVRWQQFKVPLYYTFLLAVAVGPAVLLYRSMKEFVNWRAFSLTTLWVLLTACIWEVTLALPKKWWGYQDDAMMNFYIDNWTFGEWRFPLEALLVWFIVTFTSVLVYEAVKAYQYDVRPPMVRLFGERGRR